MASVLHVFLEVLFCRLSLGVRVRVRVHSIHMRSKCAAVSFMLNASHDVWCQDCTSSSVEHVPVCMPVHDGARQLALQLLYDDRGTRYATDSGTAQPPHNNDSYNKD